MTKPTSPHAPWNNPSAPILQRRILFHPPFKTAAAASSFAPPSLQPINSLPVEPPSSRNGEEAVRIRSEPPSQLQKPLRHKSEMLECLQIRRIGAGLENLGNTCFLNSVLQCLTYTPPLAAYLQSGRHKSTCRVSGFCAVCVLEAHVKQALTVPGRVISPTTFVKNLRCISRSFRMGRQEDAHEYMRYLIEALQKCCLPVARPSDLSQKVQKNLIYKIFGGRLRSQVKCMHCSFCSNTYDPFLDLSLEIVRADSLQKALARFTAVEELDGDNKYICSKCKMKVRALKQFTVDETPQILTIQFKRFSSSAGLGGKIDKKIQFGRTLDMKPFMSNEEDELLQYTLYAVLVHSGCSTHSGHYYCFVRTATDMWHLLDDGWVSQVSEKAVLDQKAYILFYMREPQPSPLSKIENGPCGKSFKQMLHGNAIAVIGRDPIGSLQENKTRNEEVPSVTAKEGQTVANDVNGNASLGYVNGRPPPPETNGQTVSLVTNGQNVPMSRKRPFLVAGNGNGHAKEVNQQTVVGQGISSSQRNTVCNLSRSSPLSFLKLHKPEVSYKVKSHDEISSECDRGPSRLRLPSYTQLLFLQTRCYFLMKAIATLRKRKLATKRVQGSHKIGLQTLAIADRKMSRRVKGKRRDLISEVATAFKKRKAFCAPQSSSNHYGPTKNRSLEKYHFYEEDKPVDCLKTADLVSNASTDQLGPCISSAKETCFNCTGNISGKMAGKVFTDADLTEQRLMALSERVSKVKLQPQDVCAHEPHPNGLSKNGSVNKSKEANSNGYMCEVAQLKDVQTQSEHAGTGPNTGLKSICKMNVENGEVLSPADDAFLESYKLYGIAVPSWNDIDGCETGTRETDTLLHEETRHCGHVLDDWDEDYDRGKRKKVRSQSGKSQIGNIEDFNGRNPFQALASSELHGVNGQEKKFKKKQQAHRSRSGGAKQRKSRS